MTTPPTDALPNGARPSTVEGPLAVPGAAEEAAGRADLEAPSNVLRLLIVEDELVVAEDIREIVLQLGHEVVGVCVTGEEAIRTAAHTHPDLVLMDIVLGGDMDGVTAADILRQRQDAATVFLTGQADDATLRRAKLSGPFGYVVKPFSERDLHVAIEVAAQRHRLERRLRESEERYQLAVRGTNDGIWDWNLRNGVITFSPRWLEMLGLPPENRRGDRETWLGLVRPEDRALFEDKLDEHLRGETPFLECEARMSHARGAIRWMLCRGASVLDAAGRPVRLAGSLTDMTDRKNFDGVTGLPGRSLLADRLRQGLARARREPEHRLAIVVIDIDRFKRLIAGLGRRAGDALLAAIARRFQEALRAQDTIGRLGRTLGRMSGDEFIVLLEGRLNEGRVVRVVNRLFESLKQPIPIEGRQVFVEARAGIVLEDGRRNDPDGLLSDAENALHDAKRSADSRYILFDPEMHVRAIEQVRLEMDLRRAVANGELTVHYQPIVSLTTGAVLGFEALARWPHPERGFIPPGLFIPLAEEVGLIESVGMFVLEEAAGQLRAWIDALPDCAPVFVSVNLSAVQFAEPDLVTRVLDTLARTGLDGRMLRLEITETALMAAPEYAAKKLSQLQTMGVRFSLDDFGTGYSSLSYLTQFPVDRLKLDRSFVVAATRDDRQRRLLETITLLAERLDMGVTAEGVETEEQRDLCARLGCDRAQGYLFARPLPPEQAIRLLGPPAPPE